MRNRFTACAVYLLAAWVVAVGWVPCGATSLKKMTVADLTSYGSVIVVGNITHVSDGFDSNNLPYTEVTINVSESIRGGVTGTYTFRQFGLAAPRDMGDGRTYVGVSPDGFPRFRDGEEVMLFLFETTSLGFQSTVGLMQGKFMVDGDRVANDINNLDLFKDISVDETMLNPEELKLLDTKKGPVSKSAFTSFVTKAVENGWFE